MALVGLGLAGLLFGAILRSVMVLRRTPTPRRQPRRAACATCPAAGACQSGAVPECEARSSA